MRRTLSEAARAVANPTLTLANRQPASGTTRPETLKQMSRRKPTR